METIKLKNLYPYEELEKSETEKLFEVNKITKTRNDSKKKNIREHYGIEQSFVLYNVAKKYKCKNMLEIGTGRGTGSYSVSLLEHVKRVDTFDIIEHTKKVPMAVNFKSFYGSNKDLYNMIKYEEKGKINFKHINELNSIYLKNNENKFDMAFIDGNHTNYNIIMNDFKNCLKLTNDEGIIVFDDYGNFPVVTRVVNDIMEKYSDFKYIMVPFRGHYFKEWSKGEEEKGSGEVLCFKKKEMYYSVV